MSRDINRDMKDYLPKFYEDSKVAGNIIDRESEEFSSLNAAVLDVIDQFTIETATWGLIRWEKICGINTDLTKPIEQRRSIIKSKMRGVGTVTVLLIQSVAEAWHNGSVEVSEQFSAYTVLVTFTSRTGIPGNMPDIKAALREIVPAHLDVAFKFKYLYWDTLDAQAYTWNDFDALAIKWDSLETMI